MTRVNSAQPTMVPGQTFEVNAVLADPKQAGMQLSIQWPYASSLHCEILVNDQIIAQADQFVAPRSSRRKNDPVYGVLRCGPRWTTSRSGNTAPRRPRTRRRAAGRPGRSTAEPARTAGA